MDVRQRVSWELVFLIGTAMTVVGFFATSRNIAHFLIAGGAVAMTAGVTMWVYATRQ
jgi:hypothetical protein